MDAHCISVVRGRTSEGRSGKRRGGFVDACWGGSYDSRTVKRLAGLLTSLLAATRPRQWAKNGIIYVALIFTVNQSWDPGAPGSFWASS